VNTEEIVTELKQERDRLGRAIAALEGANSSGAARKTKVAIPRVMQVKGKQGRALTLEGRRRISLVMKKRWAERKKMGS
jgi:hypothetical protein